MAPDFISSVHKQKPVSIIRVLNLPLNVNWKAWTDPESFKKWWGPNDYTCPSCSIDFRVGGKYLASMKGPDGKEIWSTGTYKEINPLKKIVYADHFSDSKGNVIPASDLNMPGEWPLETPVTLTFEEDGDKTKMTLVHEGIPAESYEDCIAGWNQCLDKLERNVR